MAKRKGTRASNDRLVGFAKDLGNMLGTAQANAQRWLNQRSEVAKTLAGIRDTAAQMLSDLGEAAQTARRRGQKFAGSAFAAAPAPRKRRKMTAAQKKAVSARMKKYWAKRRKASASSSRKTASAT